MRAKNIIVERYIWNPEAKEEYSTLVIKNQNHTVIAESKHYPRNEEIRLEFNNLVFVCTDNDEILITFASIQKYIENGK